MNFKHVFTIEDNPGAPVPPPLLYAISLLAGYLIQSYLPLSSSIFQTISIKIVTIILLIISLIISFFSIRQFWKSRNTLISIKPATSLQTSGIYQFTRNPMYVGLSSLYLSFSFFLGSWWYFILFPFLQLIIQEYNIKREERYLERAFGEDYQNYKRNVRRWL